MAYYDSSKIVVFPSSSAVDSGKRLTEDNMKSIVTRITERNYLLDSSSFQITKSNGNITISSGSANIQGYKVVTTSSITVNNPDTDGTYIIGLRLRFDSGTGNILGDVDGSNVGVDIGFFLKSSYANDKNILRLADGVLSSGTLTITTDPDILYRIDNALYAKEAGGVIYDGNTYVINQNLRTTDDVVFKSVKTDTLTFKDGNVYSNLKTVLDSVKDIIKKLKGTSAWDTNPSKTLEALADEKLDKTEVVELATANKILRLNAQGVLPASITGSSKSSETATSSTYARYVGDAMNHYALNQNLRKSDSPTFNNLYIGNQSSFVNFKYAENKLSIYSAGSIGLVANGSEKFGLDSLGNVTVTGTLRASKVYNAVYNDYAEWYEKDNPDEEILPGDIVEINPDTGKYRLCTSIASNLVIGVCSDTYGHILGGDDLENMEDNNKKYVPVGLSGRVYVNVEDGVNIMPGQLIVSSYNGKAMTKVKSPDGSVIGKALGYVDKINGVRKVLMQIMLR